MTSIDSTSLPTPSALSWEDGTEQLQNKWQQGGVLATHFPDPAQQPAVVDLIYEGKHGSVLDAIWRHYSDHNGTDFTLQLPGDAFPRRWVHRAPPALEWQNETAGGARVFLEETLAFA